MPLSRSSPYLSVASIWLSRVVGSIRGHDPHLVLNLALSIPFAKLRILFNVSWGQVWHHFSSQGFLSHPVLCANLFSLFDAWRRSALCSELSGCSTPVYIYRFIVVYSHLCLPRYVVDQALVGWESFGVLWLALWFSQMLWSQLESSVTSRSNSLFLNKGYLPLSSTGIQHLPVIFIIERIFGLIIDARVIRWERHSPHASICIKPWVRVHAATYTYA